jgi:hypothetical protein
MTAFAILAGWLTVRVWPSAAGFVYGVPIIVLGRLLEAPGRWPALRACTDLTHNPEIGSDLNEQILEQQARERNLP